MDLNSRKEQFSRAYVSALCSSVGCAIADWNVDADSVDMTLKQIQATGTIPSPHLDIQLKATARAAVGGQRVRFPLKTKNFDDLRQPAHFPRILVVVTLPSDDVSDWIDHTDGTHLALCGAAFWAHPSRLPPSANVKSTTVSLDQRLTVDVLADLMDRISNQRPLRDP